MKQSTSNKTQRRHTQRSMLIAAAATNDPESLRAAVAACKGLVMSRDVHHLPRCVRSAIAKDAVLAYALR